MGVVGTVLGTLGMSYLQGRSAQAQYNAQAAQAEANARIQERNAEISRQNSERARQNAEQTARNNAMNAENQRRQALMREGAQRARIGASGLQTTGSAAAALADTRFAINQDTAAALYNGRQQVDKIFGQATDYTNQAAQYQYNADVANANARDFRAAGKRAMWGSLLGGAFSLAGSLYSSHSAAAQAANGTDAWSGSGGWDSGSQYSTFHGSRGAATNFAPTISKNTVRPTSYLAYPWGKR